MLLTEEVFSAEYAKHFTRTISAVRTRFHLSWELAEDIAQAAWVRAWEKRAQFEGRSSVYTWVTRIAYSIWFTSLRQMRGKQFEEFGESAGKLCYESDIENQLDCERLRGCLFPAESAVVALRLVGYSPAETALLVDRTEKAVKSNMFRAVAHMRMVAGAPPRARSAHA